MAIQLALSSQPYMRTAAILPVKRFVHAKSRLGASVSNPLRGELARAMVGDVLVALSKTRSIERTIVVTGEESVAAAARYLGGLVVQDTAEPTQSAAVSLGIASAVAEVFERVLCVPGDCPALDPVELDSLLDGTSDGVTIIPDRHGTGTNGLLLAPPDAIAPSFGPGSCERHRLLAHAAGADCRVKRVSSLLLDIDTGADLAVLRERLNGEPVQAPRTRAVLGIAGRAGPSHVQGDTATARLARQAGYHVMGAAAAEIAPETENHIADAAGAHANASAR
jgi:2-phospho-L-lactate/phosphoenolpyruvate guanylyltransferase